MSKAAGTRAGAGTADDAAQSGRFVAAEIVDDDDIARPENRNELLFDISSEAFAVDRPVEDTRGDEAVTAQGAEEVPGRVAPSSRGVK